MNAIEPLTTRRPEPTPRIHSFESGAQPDPRSNS
jgi:hypothetical protein